MVKSQKDFQHYHYELIQLSATGLSVVIIVCHSVLRISEMTYSAIKEFWHTFPERFSTALTLLGWISRFLQVLCHPKIS